MEQGGRTALTQDDFIPTAKEIIDMDTTVTLAALRPGQRARVAAVAGEAAMRRRLLDMGLIPGTAVACVAASPAGDPSAYLIRGAVVALRRRDAAEVALEGAAVWG